jgi:hypothetical protein
MGLATCSALAILASCPAKAQTCPETPPFLSIFIYNDTNPPRYIFTELEAGKSGDALNPGADIWMQAICKVPFSKTGENPYPQTITNRFYINPTTGIAPGQGVELKIPLFTQLKPTKDLNPKTPDQYAEWWQGENIEIYDSATNTPPTAYKQDYNGQLRPQQQPLKSEASEPVFWPTCTGIDKDKKPVACTLDFFTDGAGNLPKFDPSQLVEATLGAKQEPLRANNDDNPQYILDVRNVDFDVSYVNVAFSGAALGPYKNNQVGFVGTNRQPVIGTEGEPGFREQVKLFRTLKNWPTFISTTIGGNGPVQEAIFKLPSPLELMARLTGANPPTDLTKVPNPDQWPNSLWPAIASLKDHWEKYAVERGCPYPPKEGTFCEAILDVKNLFALNFANYEKLFDKKMCSGKAVAQTVNATLGHVYGWSPWIEAVPDTGTGCAAAINLLQNTPDSNGRQIYRDNNYALYSKVKLEFDKLQYGIFEDAKYDFDPWVEFIHGKELTEGQLKIPGAYAYSVDDAVGNIQAEGQGFIIDVGSLAHLENKEPAGPPINISFTLENPENGVEMKTYGVCGNKEENTKPVNPLFSSFVINANHPQDCPVYFTDSNGQEYTFTIDGPTTDLALIPTKDVKKSLDSWSSGTDTKPNPTIYNTTKLIKCTGNTNELSRHWCCTLLPPDKGIGQGRGTFAYSTPEDPPLAHQTNAYKVVTIPPHPVYNPKVDPACNFGK